MIKLNFFYQLNILRQLVIYTWYQSSGFVFDFDSTLNLQFSKIFYILNPIIEGEEWCAPTCEDEY
jgi:hypothetical protein